MIGTKKRKKQGIVASTTRTKLDLIVQKLEPYLRRGESMRKACLNAKIPRSTVYTYYGKDSEFTDKIDLHMAYASILINDLFFARLVDMATRQNKLQEAERKFKDGIIGHKKLASIKALNVISDRDWAFLQWFAVNSHNTRKEYGTRIDLYEKDLIDEMAENEAEGMVITKNTMEEIVRKYGRLLTLGPTTR